MTKAAFTVHSQMQDVDRQRETAAAQGQAAADRLVAQLPLIGLLAVQIFIGYEWFVSGLTKIVRGDFPAGLADELTEKSEGAPGWYAGFLDNVVIPNAKAFGYLSEIGELLIGVVLVGGALIWLFAWRDLSQAQRTGTLVAIIVASLAGVFMNVNFHLANGSAHPWLLPGDGFDEGVDLDSLMPAIQLAIAGVAGTLLWLDLRRERLDPVPSREEAAR